MVSLIPKKLRVELGKLVSWMQDYGDLLNNISQAARNPRVSLKQPVWGRSARLGGAPAPEFNFTKLAAELAPKVPYIKSQLKQLGPVGNYYSKFYDVADLNKLAALSESGDMASVGKINLGSAYKNLPTSKEPLGRGRFAEILKKYGVRET